MEKPAKHSLTCTLAQIQQVFRNSSADKYQTELGFWQEKLLLLIKVVGSRQLACPPV